MSQLTNLYTLPLPLYEAVKADPYDSQGSDITVTGLLKPIQMWVLERRHKDKLTIDLSEKLWSLYGQLMALLLERAVKASPALAKRFQVACRDFYNLTRQQSFLLNLLAKIAQQTDQFQTQCSMLGCGMVKPTENI